MRSWILGTLLCALFALLAWGQATARIHGVVQDQSGAVVPNATVKATQTETGISRTAVTEMDGSYNFANLPLGPYRLDFQKEGFATSVESGIVLQVDSDPAVPITLRPGGTNETITVEANAAQVDTTSAGVGTVIESQRILDLPLNGRQATDLIALSGLAVVTAATPPTYTMNTGPSITVAGSMSWSVQYNLDGAPHLDTYVGTPMPLPFPDALQEFKLSTSAQDASSGGHSGAVVDAVTKSGTNTFHGDLFEFFRNSDLNARDFFAAGSDGLKRNQFGGTLGRADRKRQAVLLPRISGNYHPSESGESSRLRPHRGGTERRFFAVHCGRMPCGLRQSRASPAVLSHFSGPFAMSPAAIKISSYLPQTTNPCGFVLFGTPVHQNQLQAPLENRLPAEPQAQPIRALHDHRIQTRKSRMTSRTMFSRPIRSVRTTRLRH